MFFMSFMVQINFRIQVYLIWLTVLFGASLSASAQESGISLISAPFPLFKVRNAVSLPISEAGRLIGRKKNLTSIRSRENFAPLGFGNTLTKATLVSRLPTYEA